MTESNNYNDFNTYKEFDYDKFIARQEHNIKREYRLLETISDPYSFESFFIKSKIYEKILNEIYSDEDNKILFDYSMQHPIELPNIIDTNTPALRRKVNIFKKNHKKIL